MKKKVEVCAQHFDLGQGDLHHITFGDSGTVAGGTASDPSAPHAMAWSQLVTAAQHTVDAVKQEGNLAEMGAGGEAAHAGSQGERLHTLQLQERLRQPKLPLNNRNATLGSVLNT